MTNEDKKHENAQTLSCPTNDKEIKNVIAALVKAQQEFQIPGKTGKNPQFKSRYSTLDDIYMAIRAGLSNNGLMLTHTVGVEEGRYVLITNLYHVSGEKLENRFPMFIDKQTNQGLGSARTYACRYATANLLALPSDEDDDGNAASAVTPARAPVRAPSRHPASVADTSEREPNFTQEQIDEVLEAVGEDFDLLGRITKGYGVKSLNDVPQRHFGAIMKNLNKRREVAGEIA